MIPIAAVVLGVQFRDAASLDRWMAGIRGAVSSTSLICTECNESVDTAQEYGFSPERLSACDNSRTGLRLGGSSDLNPRLATVEKRFVT